jgi:hypothetical protein
VRDRHIFDAWPIDSTKNRTYIVPALHRGAAITEAKRTQVQRYSFQICTAKYSPEVLVDIVPFFRSEVLVADAKFGVVHSEIDCPEAAARRSKIQPCCWIGGIAHSIGTEQGKTDSPWERSKVKIPQLDSGFVYGNRQVEQDPGGRKFGIALK